LRMQSSVVGHQSSARGDRPLGLESRTLTTDD
jgi:hypothetical protein